MPETNGDDSSDRLDRIEQIARVLTNTKAELQQEVKILLRGQVVLGEAMTKLADAQRRREKKQPPTSNATDES
jgi:exonuclease VII small subunit